MIRPLNGMDIQLYTEDGAEAVHDVLIGEPGTSEDDTAVFTMAIPKGDTHDWMDRRVDFFGMHLRTVGVPEQGMEALLPLRWHKKVHVEEMRITGTVTLYEAQTFARHVFPAVYYKDERGEHVTKQGARGDGSVTIRIYADRFRADAYRPKPGDMVVLDDAEYTFDTSSEQAASESMRTFRSLYPAYAVVSDVAHKLYGNLPDYLITAG